MKLYTFKTPAFRGSTKLVTIYNSDKERVGYVQRFYTNKAQRVSDFVFNNKFFVNVRTLDINNDDICIIQENFTLFRSNWNGEIKGKDSFVIKDKTVIRTNPLFECILSGKERLLIKKDFGDRRVFVLNKTDSIIAEIELTKIIPPQEITAKIYSTEDRVLVIIALYYLFTIKV